ncbi:unnamed protein product [Medioppia subpectinata]|uniref:Aminotransferase class I/classII large domain-containing protein n=1 Tax=Medioppia subpectinata TaxID=1979941 RepID=A0A7R9PU59_9ACAR|nr:unnamed protein product [Medioppia subpectinata]CAG2100436.1 unnamed protein product [Medioppia subpectinata]
MLREHPTQFDFGRGGPNFNPYNIALQAIQTVGWNETFYEVHRESGDCRGKPALRAALAQLFSALMKQTINADKEIVVTNGAYQGLYLAIKSYIKPGDEVILFEPFYNIIVDILALRQAVPVYVPLRTSDGQTARQSNDLTFDRKALEAAFTNKTKMLYINNPNNPIGKTFTEEELLFIGQLCEKHDVIILADEVYQLHIYDSDSHIRIATLPGMWKRTITVSSGGKLFNLNGWRVGWVIGPEDLLWSIRMGLYYSIQSVSRVSQQVLTSVIEIENQRLNSKDSYFSYLSKESLSKRDRFMSAFEGTGVDIIKPNSGIYLFANFSNVINKIDLSSEKDTKRGLRLTYWLLKQKKLGTFPGDSYYSKQNKHLAEYVVR